MAVFVMFVLAMCLSYAVEGRLNPLDDHFSSLVHNQDYYHYAVVQTKTTDNFRGASAVINLQNPNVVREQYSMALIKIASDRQRTEAIALGWAVSKAINGDTNARFFEMSKVGDKICYNNNCNGQGFVQVDKNVNLGFLIPSVPGDKLVVTFILSQDAVTGDWWASVIGNIKVKIGYWPKALFTSLSNGGSFVQYGGCVQGSKESGLSPVMGSSEFPSKDYWKSAYFSNMTIAHSYYVLKDVQAYEVETSVSNTSCYNVEVYGYQSIEVGFTMSYSGPRGNCGR